MGNGALYMQDEYVFVKVNRSIWEKLLKRVDELEKRHRHIELEELVQKNKDKIRELDVARS